MIHDDEIGCRIVEFGRPETPIWSALARTDDYNVTNAIWFAEAGSEIGGKEPATFLGRKASEARPEVMLVFLRKESVKKIIERLQVIADEWDDYDANRVREAVGQDRGPSDAASPGGGGGGGNPQTT